MGKILYAEANDLCYLVFAGNMKALGCNPANIERASTPEEAVDYFKKNLDSIDVVFSEIMFHNDSQKDGFWLAEQIYLIDCFTPIFALTASISKYNEERLENTNFLDFLQKPIYKDSLSTFLRSYELL